MAPRLKGHSGEGTVPGVEGGCRGPSVRLAVAPIWVDQEAEVGRDAGLGYRLQGLAHLVSLLLQLGLLKVHQLS